jgi:hypothetical protein
MSGCAQENSIRSNVPNPHIPQSKHPTSSHPSIPQSSNRPLPTLAPLSPPASRLTVVPRRLPLLALLPVSPVDPWATDPRRAGEQDEAGGTADHPARSLHAFHSRDGTPFATRQAQVGPKSHRPGKDEQTNLWRLGAPSDRVVPHPAQRRPGQSTAQSTDRAAPGARPRGQASG